MEVIYGHVYFYPYNIFICTLNNKICFSVITRCLSCYFLPNFVTVASNFDLGNTKSLGIACHNGPVPYCYYYYINLFNIYIYILFLEII